MKRLILLSLCAVCFAADTSDLKLKLRENERDYYLTLLEISQLQAKALDLQNQINRQYADLARTCEGKKVMSRATLTCEGK